MTLTETHTYTHTHTHTSDSALNTLALVSELRCSVAGHRMHETDAAASAACAFKDTLERVMHANCIGMRKSETNAQDSVVPTPGHRTHQTLCVKSVHCMHTVHNARCNR